MQILHQNVIAFQPVVPFKPFRIRILLGGKSMPMPIAMAIHRKHSINIRAPPLCMTNDDSLEDCDDDDNDDDANINSYSDPATATGANKRLLLTKEQLKELPIAILLSTLKRYDIRIPPTAARGELIDLIVQYERERETSQQREQRDNDMNVNMNTDATSNTSTRSTYIGISPDTNGINRGPTRNQPKKKSRATTSSSSAGNGDGNGNGNGPTSPRMERNRREMRRQRNNPPQGWDEIDSFIPKEARKWGLQAVDGVTNVARSASNEMGRRIVKLKRARRSGDGDDDGDGDGVKEVDWYYVSRDEQVDRPRSRKVKSKQSRPRRSPDGDGVRRKKKRPKKSVNMNVGPCDREPLALLSPALQDVVYFPDLENNDDSSSTTTTTNGDVLNEEPKEKPKPKRRRDFPKSTRTNRNPTNAQKKVYSVYPQDEDNSDLEELYGKAAAGAIDSVGEFLADVSEGKYYNRNGTESFRGVNKTAGRPRGTKRNASKPRYWKDRLTERVDYALGVHEDGEYYQKWQDRLEREKASEDGNDPVSIFYGRQKKHRGPKKNVPFWEEDGSLMSLFFGRTPNGKQLTFNKMFERDMSVNVCTSLFKSTFKSTLAVLSYLCRWASCRGALPQPIVVFFLAASALSAPRRKKMMTVAITLVAIRTLAEAMHGYTYGNQDWEDEPEEDWEDEPDHNEASRRGGDDTWEGDGL